MAETEEFAHGFHYGDYFGVTFYGQTMDGIGVDRLSVSDSYIHPLFHGILDRNWRECGGENMPRLVSEWNTLEGWAGCGGDRVPIAPEVAIEFADAISQLGVEDIASHRAGCTTLECMRCAGVVREFIANCLASGLTLVIEDD